MRPPWRVAAVDDEPLARAALRGLLRQDPEVELVVECIGAEAPRRLVEERVELLFLDVQMPEVDGFGVLETLLAQGAALPATVFVTAHDAYAVRAFEVQALDYLLKPFDDARFFAALDRAKAHLARAEPAATAEQLLRLLEGHGRRERAERFLVRSRGKVLVVRAEEIDWIESADYYATLHVGARSHLLRQTMDELEASLDPARFVRVHRGAIVNLDRVREAQPLFRGDWCLTLADGTEVKLSRTRRAAFEERFAAPRGR